MFQAFGFILAHNFVLELHICFKRGDAESTHSNVLNVLSCYEDNEQNLLPKDKLLLETWYFVTSWLYFAASEDLPSWSNKPERDQTSSKIFLLEKSDGPKFMLVN